MKQQILNGEARVYGCREGMKEGKEENETKQKANKLVHNVNVQPNLSRRIRSFTYYYYYDFPSVVHTSIISPPAPSPAFPSCVCFRLAWLGAFFSIFYIFHHFHFFIQGYYLEGQMPKQRGMRPFLYLVIYVLP